MSPKNSYLLFILFMLLTTTNFIFAQNINTFTKLIDVKGHHDNAYAIAETKDGGFVIAGGSVCIFPEGTIGCITVARTDSLGNTLWTEEYTTSPNGLSVSWGSILVLEDESIIIGGDTYSYDISNSADAMILKLSPTGDSLWLKTYGGNYVEQIHDINLATDGGFILVGQTYSFTNGSADMYLVKTDSEGNLEWQQNFGGDKVDAALTVAADIDGGYIMGGITRSEGLGNGDICIIKTDSLGNKIWDKIIGTAGYDNIGYINPSKVYGYILCGTLDADSMVIEDHNIRNSYFARLDYDGTIIAENLIAQPFTCYMNQLQELPNGDMLFLGNTGNYGYNILGATDAITRYYGWLGKLDVMGQLVWDRAYTYTAHEPSYTRWYSLFRHMTLTQDGGIAITGKNNGADRIAGDTTVNLWLLKLDENGCLLASDCQQDSMQFITNVAEITPNNIPNKLSSQLHIAPNPAREKTLISWQNEIVQPFFSREILIYDLKGQLIKQETVPFPKNQIQVSLKHFKNGVYFVVLKQNKRTIQQAKLIISN